jgi:thiamine biosynthesis protein ThiS
MKVIVNGMERELSSAAPSLAALLAELRYGPPVFVAELNGKVLSRESYASTSLAEGDTIDIYNLVDGG